jgi:2,3-dihydroxybenzoate decarboxylase
MPPDKPYLRIATEEAFCPPEMLDIYAGILAKGTIDDPGFISQWGYFMNSDSERSVFVRRMLCSLGEDRIADMDAAGIDQAILSLTAPGTQCMEKSQAVEFAEMANDYLVDGISKFPDRYFGLTAIAPQDPEHAAKEIRRGHDLGLKGVIVNSHTLNEYMDDERYDPIFEVCQALDTPLYMHPQTPSKDMIGPMMSRGLDGSIYGFGVETAVHLLRIVISGVLDRFPRLKLVAGHCGEAIPFWLYRLDHMHAAMIRASRYPGVRPLERKISEYVKENFWITTSGMAWPPAIEFCQRVLGIDRVLYAMDYPYQYVPAEVGWTEQVDVDAQGMKKLFQTNAETLFRLNA